MVDLSGLKEYVGSIIRMFRESKGLTLIELANDLDVTIRPSDRVAALVRRIYSNKSNLLI